MFEPATQLLIAKIAVPGVLGVAAFCILYQYFRTRRRHAWPRTEGELLSVRVASGKRPGRRGKSFEAYWVEVEYDYNVSGRDLKGSRIAEDVTFFTKPEHAQNIVKTFEVGRKLPVYYNPQNPEVSFLVPGGGVGGMPLLLLSLGLILADVALTLWFLSLD